MSIKIAPLIWSEEWVNYRLNTIRSRRQLDTKLFGIAVFLHLLGGAGFLLWVFKCLIEGK